MCIYEFIEELQKMIDNLEEDQIVALTINADLEYYIHNERGIVQVFETKEDYIVVKEITEEVEETLFILKQDSIIAVSIRENPLLQGEL